MTNYKALMVSQGLSFFQRGYTCGGGGNLSLKLPDGTILATPTGSCLGRLVEEELSVVTLDGKLLSGKKASKEVGFHLDIYRSNPAVNAVVHLHSTYLTALSSIGHVATDNVIEAFTPYYVMRIGKLPLLPYFRPGSSDIGKEIAKYTAQGYTAVLLANHGPVVTGTDFINASDNAEELEETAKLKFLLKDMPVRYLTASEKEALGEMRS
ncbi:aldolase [Enterobacteriaceae bacterium RIT697]|uniref:3-oxo-tetronate 4-phosphate decarboxylase n=1 Tax=Pantoea endophytica TaxID=92488 RepID=UPI0012AE75AE|nr:aldolase [Pantoea endophytica]MRT24944.1 aldolase [Enterobacteriaceae bacterium RIT697]